jgi:hypothetical protein
VAATAASRSFAGIGKAAKAVCQIIEVAKKQKFASLSIKGARQASNLSGPFQHVHQIFRPYFFRRLLQFVLLPPMVIRHA